MPKPTCNCRGPGPLPVLLSLQGRGVYVALIGLLTIANAQQPSFLWAKRAGGPATTDVSISDLPGGICVGPAGEITVVGQFYQSATFGTRTLTAKGVNPGEPGYEDAFFVRYDPSGTVPWAQRAGSASSDVAFAVCADRDGNVYATGKFGMLAKFGSQMLAPPPSAPYGNYDAFLTKLDSSGTFLWTTQIGTERNDCGYAVAIDPDGNCVVAGSYDRDDRYNGAIFVAKYAHSGERLWLQRFGGSQDSLAFAVSINSAGDIFIAGFCTGQSVFGTIYVSSVAAQDGFVAKLDAAGNPIWVKTIGSFASDWASGAGAGPDGSVYVTGHLNAGSSQFVNKYSAVGTLLWTRQDGGGAMAVDANGYAYASAYAGQIHAVFQPPFYAAPSLLSIYSPKGNLVKTVTSTGTRTNYVYALALDGVGNMNALGFFNGTGTFGESTLRSLGDDVWIARLDSGRPKLGWTLSQGKLIVSWPTNAVGFGLQTAAAIDPAVRWGAFDGITEKSGTNYQATVPTEGPQRFFRLTAP